MEQLKRVVPCVFEYALFTETMVLLVRYIIVIWKGAFIR